MGGGLPGFLDSGVEAIIMQWNPIIHALKPAGTPDCSLPQQVSHITTHTG